MLAAGKELQLIALILGAIVVFGVSFLLKRLRGQNPDTNIPPETNQTEEHGPVAAVVRKEAFGCSLMIVGLAVLVVIGLIWGAIQRWLG